MTAGVMLAVVLAAVAAWLVVAPLLREDAAEAERISSAISEERDLRSRREMLMASLKDLEDDRATGKVDQDDYARIHHELSSEAIAIMKQIDALDEARRKGAPVEVPRPPDASGSRA